ncbi:hypothetical protein CCP3SC5AM1_100009 [Gammaproteobacteria bacterium]
MSPRNLAREGGRKEDGLLQPSSKNAGLSRRSGHAAQVTHILRGDLVLC